MVFLKAIDFFDMAVAMVAAAAAVTLAGMAVLAAKVLCAGGSVVTWWSQGGRPLLLERGAATHVHSLHSLPPSGELTGRRTSSQTN